jgi:hypothetical protein
MFVSLAAISMVPFSLNHLGTSLAGELKSRVTMAR